MALAAYRSVLKAARLAFEGDLRMYNAARLEAGRKFRENKALRAQDPEAEVKLAEAQEIARILRENVVQGEATEGKSHYRLRLHDETERGDNESIKMKTPLAQGAKKWRSSTS